MTNQSMFVKPFDRKEYCRLVKIGAVKRSTDALPGLVLVDGVLVVFADIAGMSARFHENENENDTDDVTLPEVPES